MTDRDIWNDSGWMQRRQTYKRYKEWYEGVPLAATMEKRDKSSGEKIRRFPLNFNITKIACDVHRDIMRGIPDYDDPLAVRATVEREDSPDLAERLERVVNEKVWRPSHGGPLQQEAMLAMNIYGGTVFKLAWEPWEQDLPYRLAVRLIRNPGHINPTADWLNPWKLLECYIGYEISARDAEIKYGIKVPNSKRDALYMEHWTPTEYRIAIDDQVPVMKWNNRKFKLEGENPWGFVPIFYVPHERTTKELFGDSLIPCQEKLVKEINSRARDLADIVRATTPGLLFGRDIDRTLSVRRVKVDGLEVKKIIDLGRSRPTQSGGGSPDVFPSPTPDIPQALVEFPRTLLDFWMMIARISPAIFGLDDTRSGRITGPAIAQRMWTSIAYATTGRINFSDAKTSVDKSIAMLLVSKEAAGAFEELGIESPGVTREMAQMNISQVYPPMIPLDREERHREMIDRLRESGVSIEAYLREMGVKDIDGERTRIVAWMEERARIEAVSKPQPQGGSGD